MNKRVLTKINDKLNDLKTGDPFLPPDTNTARTLEVVPVHDNVDHKVQGDWDPRYRCQTNELSVAEKSSSAMMIAVEEGYKTLAGDTANYTADMLTQRLLLQYQKDGVK